MYRQGDLLIIKRDEKPAYEEKNIVAGGVVMRGEVSGHSHKLEGGQVIRKFGNEIYLIVNDDGKLLHEEHDPIHLPAGYYAVRVQRQYVGKGETENVYD